MPDHAFNVMMLVTAVTGAVVAHMKRPVWARFTGTGDEFAADKWRWRGFVGIGVATFAATILMRRWGML